MAKQLGLPIERVPLPTMRPTVQPRASLSELYSVNPRLFWQTLLIWGGSASAVYGYYLWGPTIVALALKVEPAVAAKYFIYVSGAGVIGKILVSLIALEMGRRSLGIVFGFISAVLLVVGGIFQRCAGRRIPDVHHPDRTRRPSLPRAGSPTSRPTRSSNTG